MTNVETKAPEAPPAGPGQASPSWGWLRWAWRNLTSMRTAVMLLALLALAAIPGSLFPQRNVASDPAAVINYAQENPRVAPWLDRLGMFDVYASPWFAAIYVLLLVSMTGCVLPRSRRLWQSVRSAPPPAPRNLARLEGHHSWTTSGEPAEIIATAAAHLRRRGFRVLTSTDEVRAERGYLREVGNLAFHLSLLVLLVGIAGGKLIGFEGRVAVAEGGTFANDLSQYDAFTPSAWTDVDNLEPVSFRLEDFDVSYQTSGPNTGQPTKFAARLAYRAGNGEEQTITVEPNHPLDVNETKFFLTGNGYAPIVTVRDGRDSVVFTGPVLFLPLDTDNASEGVIKAPDAQPAQLAFEGFFFPTADVGPQGPYSMFPDTLNPQLFLTAFTGDLGLSDGVPQSVFTLDKDELTQVRRDGRPFSQALSVGETMRLPDGQGTLTFDGVSRFANFQIAYDPGKEITLVAAIVLFVGLTTSLIVRRRRLWMRLRPSADAGTMVEIAGYSLTRREPPPNEIKNLVAALTSPHLTTPVNKDTPR
ncbi:cytochrome c biogenesis protein ResB [uncultured Nocardioides sp.]|uniref:cytochrome c biogenesis protein ResB n=1 Tax=uncultured Nocardioides sp. TaxID=198441 RepID=UPI00262E91A0|nr:cytochrome c biogenesis protein ResB [uncultured Nocardioides sp.]